jgi:hypothetical protein
MDSEPFQDRSRIRRNSEAEAKPQLRGDAEPGLGLDNPNPIACSKFESMLSLRRELWAARRGPSAFGVWSGRGLPYNTHTIKLRTSDLPKQERDKPAVRPGPSFFQAPFPSLFSATNQPHPLCPLPFSPFACVAFCWAEGLFCPFPVCLAVFTFCLGSIFERLRGSRLLR